MLIKLLRPIKKFAGKCIRLAYKLTYRLFKVDDKLVIFISFHGRGYSDNPKAIYEQMRQDPRFVGYRFIWFIKNHKEKNIHIEGAEIKEYFSIPYFYYLITFGYSFLFFFSLIGFSVYPIILRGIFSFSKFSFIGSLRSASQSISYEITFSFYMLLLLSKNALQFSLGSL